MTDTLNINTGEKHLAVSVDGVNGREITFNPNDVRFMEHLHRFYQLTMQKAREWEEKQAGVEEEIASVSTDKNGIPETLKPAIKPIEEMNAFMREQIDELFGEGTANAVFGDTVYRNPAVYVQLVEGIKGYIQPVREKKTSQYVKPRRAKPKAKPRKRAAKKK